MLTTFRYQYSHLSIIYVYNEPQLWVNISLSDENKIKNAHQVAAYN